ncbi:MAG: dihydrofolate reductase [Rhizobiaceae bacterium]|nr:dihydrofolate reductase [Rhizobiaceae bacterium]
MTVALVVAVARNGVIGREGGLPWRLSTDMKRFKALTLGHPIVMGRRTWESFPKRPLPERTNIVVTRNADFSGEGAVRAGSFEEALGMARKAPGGEAVQVIGGGQIYAQAMPVADRLDVTHVLADFEGDTQFPVIDPAIWYEAHGEDVPAGPKDDFATRYAVYLRRTGK